MKVITIINQLYFNEESPTNFPHAAPCAAKSGSWKTK